MRRYWWAGLVSVVAVLAAVGILAISFWQEIEWQVEETVVAKGSEIKVWDRYVLAGYREELPEKVWLPRTPQYMVETAYDRWRLWQAGETEERLRRLMELSDKRMAVVADLFADNQGKEALEVVVKAVYYWESARLLWAAENDGGQEMKWWGQRLREQGMREMNMVNLMMGAISDEGKNGLARMAQTLELGIKQINI